MRSQKLTVIHLQPLGRHSQHQSPIWYPIRWSESHTNLRIHIFYDSLLAVLPVCFVLLDHLSLELTRSIIQN